MLTNKKLFWQVQRRRQKKNTRWTPKLGQAMDFRNFNISCHTIYLEYRYYWARKKYMYCSGLL